MPIDSALEPQSVDTSDLSDPRVPVYSGDQQRIVIGPYGLRAGWSLLIFLLLLSLLAAVRVGIGKHHGSAGTAAAHTPKVSLAERPVISVLSSHGLPLALMLLLS